MSHHILSDKNLESHRIKAKMSIIDDRLRQLEQDISQSLNSMRDTLFRAQEESIH